MDYLEILIFRIAMWFIKRAFNLNCDTYYRGCIECRAKDAYDFLQETIELIKWK